MTVYTSKGGLLVQIDLSDSGCLTLLLSDDELANLGLSFEELDYQSPKTRRMLRALLQLARRETGYTPQGALLVEALPLEGGCLLLVTPDSARRTMPEAVGPAAFFVAEADALLQIATAWPRGPHPLGESSSLYRGEDGFLLILYGGAEAPVLFECAEPLDDGEGAAAWAAEHGTPLFIGDALPRLRRLVRS